MRTTIFPLLLIAAVLLVPSIGLAQPPACDPDGPYQGQVGDPVQFDGTRSVAFPPHMILLYEWEFGDGETGTGPTPTHVYIAPRLYQVLLTVTDDQDLPVQCGTTATITPPTAIEAGTWGWIKAIYR
jgi:chitodextrinase